jgi:hypothetical protein
LQLGRKKSELLGATEVEVALVGAGGLHHLAADDLESAPCATVGTSIEPVAPAFLAAAIDFAVSKNYPAMFWTVQSRTDRVQR